MLILVVLFYQFSWEMSGITIVEVMPRTIHGDWPCWVCKLWGLCFAIFVLLPNNHPIEVWLATTSHRYHHHHAITTTITPLPPSRQHHHHAITTTSTPPSPSRHQHHHHRHCHCHYHHHLTVRKNYDHQSQTSITPSLPSPFPCHHSSHWLTCTTVMVVSYCFGKVG